MVAPAQAARRQQDSDASARYASTRPMLERPAVKQPEPLFVSQLQRREYPATFGAPFEFGVSLTFDRRPVLFTGAPQRFRSRVFATDAQLRRLASRLHWLRLSREN